MGLNLGLEETSSTSEISCWRISALTTRIWSSQCYFLSIHSLVILTNMYMSLYSSYIALELNYHRNNQTMRSMCYS